MLRFIPAFQKVLQCCETQLITRRMRERSCINYKGKGTKNTTPARRERRKTREKGKGADHAWNDPPL